MNTIFTDCGIIYWHLNVNHKQTDKGDKSLVDDLNMERGIVSGRVAFVATIR